MGSMWRQWRVTKTLTPNNKVDFKKDYAMNINRAKKPSKVVVVEIDYVMEVSEGNMLSVHTLSMTCWWLDDYDAPHNTTRSHLTIKAYNLCLWHLDVFFHLTYLLDIVRRTVYFNILQLDWSILFLYFSVFLFLFELSVSNKASSPLRFQKYSDSDFHMLACNIDIFILSLYLTHVAVTSLFLWIFDMPT